MTELLNSKTLTLQPNVNTKIENYTSSQSNTSKCFDTSLISKLVLFACWPAVCCLHTAFNSIIQHTQPWSLSLSPVREDDFARNFVRLRWHRGKLNLLLYQKKKQHRIYWPSTATTFPIQFTFYTLSLFFVLVWTRCAQSPETLHDSTDNKVN